MLAGLLQMGEERPRRPILPEAALMRLREHQELYARWLLGPAPWRVGDVVTLRRDCPIGGHGTILMVVDTDRQPASLDARRDDSGYPVSGAGQLTEPPPRLRRTGLREDTRVALIAPDEDSTIRAMWIEGWMLEPWSVERAERHQQLADLEVSGRGQ